MLSLTNLTYYKQHQGRKCFEGIEQSINLCMRSVVVVDGSLMVISPTPSIASQNLQHKNTEFPKKEKKLR